MSGAIVANFGHRPNLAWRQMKLSILVPIIFWVSVIIIPIPDQHTIDIWQENIPFSLKISDVPFYKTFPVDAAPIPATVHTPVAEIDPKEYKVEMWPYSNDCGYQGFLGSCEPHKYIIPDNKVVKYAASFLNVNIYGALEWEMPNPFNLHGIFYNNYVPDNEKYPPGEDYWVNPDHYLLNNMSGDCEDAAFAVASVLESKGIKTKIVGGYLTYNDQRLRDWIVEYKVNRTYCRYFGGGLDSGFIPRGKFEHDKTKHGIDFEPVLMFDKRTYYQEYNKEW